MEATRQFTPNIGCLQDRSAVTCGDLRWPDVGHSPGYGQPGEVSVAVEIDQGRSAQWLTSIASLDVVKYRLILLLLDDGSSRRRRDDSFPSSSKSRSYFIG